MTSMRRALLLSCCLAGSGMALPVGATAGVFVNIDVAPPPPQVEVFPGPRVGYVWAPGYWEWRGGRHVWIGGRWVGERRGYHWAPDRWEQAGPHWHRVPGHWER